jgi:hypothetical protein
MADRSSPPRSQPGRALTDLFGAAIEGAPDERLMDLELLALIEGRRYFFEWIEDLRGGCAPAEPGSEGAPAAPGEPAGEQRPANPAQFLRAWSDSTARLIQILRARRALVERGGADAEILEALVTLLEESPGLRIAGGGTEVVRHG